MVWRDAHGKALADYPRPSLAVDVALLTVRDGKLAVVVRKREEAHRTGEWALPGTFVRVDERLSDSVQRALREKAGVDVFQPTQLEVFDDPERDDRGRVISVAFADLIPERSLMPGAYQTAFLEGDPPRPKLPGNRRALAYDHNEIVAQAVAKIRAAYETSPDPYGLLSADTFTLLELREWHEAVAGHPLQKDTFRRHMEPQLVALEEHRRGGPGKPARLFRRTG